MDYETLIYQILESELIENPSKIRKISKTLAELLLFKHEQKQALIEMMQDDGCNDMKCNENISYVIKRLDNEKD